MKKNDKQLALVKKVRSIRVDHLKRLATELSREANTLKSTLGEAENHLDHTLQSNLRRETQALTVLREKEEVKITEIIDFIKSQQISIKRLGDAQSRIDLVKENLYEKKQVLLEFKEQLTDAEKKLIGLEEFMKNGPWK